MKLKRFDDINERRYEPTAEKTVYQIDNTLDCLGSAQEYLDNIEEYYNNIEDFSTRDSIRRSIYEINETRNMLSEMQEELKKSTKE